MTRWQNLVWGSSWKKKLKKIEGLVRVQMGSLSSGSSDWHDTDEMVLTSGAVPGHWVSGQRDGTCKGEGSTEGGEGGGEKRRRGKGMGGGCDDQHARLRARLKEEEGGGSKSTW